MTKTFHKEQYDTVEELVEIKDLIVHNDEVNTFDWVIDSLMDICQHSEEQAEQCTVLIHFKGRTSVKNGTYEKLHPLKDSLSDRGINATIE